ncbi:MAG: hypothetical protein AAFN43_00060 [Pseudomonadota bacterium]
MLGLLIQFLAFFFYAVGGYLAIRGTLDIGQLIGVIVAYKDLPAPVRGLIDHDQKRLVVEARYEQIIEQFTTDDLQPAELQKVPEGEIPHIETGYEISRLGVLDDTGSKLLDSATANIGKDEKIVVVGNFGSGINPFAEVLAGVLPPTSGKVMLDGKPIEEQPEYFKGRRISYLDSSSYFPQGTIYQIMTYVLKNQPAGTTPDYEGMSRLEEAEIERSSNFPLDYRQSWLDYERAGATSEAELVEIIRQILKDVHIENDVRGLGLRGVLNHEKFPHLKEQILVARSRFREQLDELGFGEFVEPFDPEKYNDQSSISENLLFGTATDERFELEKLPENDLIMGLLREEGLEETLYKMGLEIAGTTIELFGDLDADNPFFDQLTYMDAEELPEYRAALSRVANLGIAEIAKKDRLLIMRLPLAYVEEQNRLGLLSDELKATIVETRKRLRVELEKLPENPIAFYEPDQYNDATTILDNVLLGRVSGLVAESGERVTSAIRDLLDEMELTDDIFRIGLEFNIGSGGKRLSETQRQKLHLARALLKRPDMLIANQPLNSLGESEREEMVEMVIARAKDTTKKPFGVVWVPMGTSLASRFDRIIVFKDGVLVSDGPRDHIVQNDSHFAEIVS